MAKAKIIDLGENLSLTVGSDGVWLNFEPESGQKATIHVASALVRGRLVADAVKDWVVETEKKYNQ